MFHQFRAVHCLLTTQRAIADLTVRSDGRQAVAAHVNMHGILLFCLHYLTGITHQVVPTRGYTQGMILFTNSPDLSKLRGLVVSMRRIELDEKDGQCITDLFIDEADLAGLSKHPMIELMYKRLQQEERDYGRADGG